MKVITYATVGFVGASLLAAAQVGAAPGDLRIMLSNRCHTSVNVAVRTLHADGQWRTMGWATVKARKVKINSLSTRNRVFYIYARTADKSASWSGKNRDGSVVKPIISTSFRHTRGPLDGPGFKMVKFRKITIPKGKTLYTFRFRCT